MAGVHSGVSETGLQHRSWLNIGQVTRALREDWRWDVTVVDDFATLSVAAQVLPRQRRLHIVPSHDAC